MLQTLPRTEQPVGLPHSEEAERAVLACCLLRSDSVSLVQDLNVEDFYLERHQLIYTSMLELYGEGTPIDLRSLQAKLEVRGAFEPVGGFAYLAGLDLDLPDLGRLEHYVKIVRECSTRRQLVMAGSQMASESLEGGMTAEEALAAAAEKITAIQLHQGAGYEPTHLADLCYEFDRFEPVSNQMLGLPTGFRPFDSMTQGLQRGRQYVVAGRPGMGKSSFAGCVAAAAADAVPPWREVEEGKDPEKAKVMIVTLEMGDDEWRDRILAQQSAAGGIPGIDLRRIQTGTIGSKGSADREHLMATIHATAGLDISFDDRRGLSAEQIAATVTAHQMRYGLDLLIVDHLGLIRYIGTKKNEVDQLGEISLKLRNLGAKNKLNIPVMTLSQLNRKCEERNPPRPKMSDLRSSGKIEEHADLVALLFREAHYLTPGSDGRCFNSAGDDVTNLAELIVAKHRNGPTGKVMLAWHGEVTGFRDLASPSHRPTPPPSPGSAFGVS